MILLPILIKLLLFFRCSIAMPINLGEIFDDLSLVQQSQVQFKNQLEMVTQLHQHFRKISETEKVEPDLVWIVADKNDNNRYAVGQFLQMLTIETGEPWSWLIRQVVSQKNYFQLVIDHMHNKIIFYDEIPGVFEAHWVMQLKENLSDCSVLVVLDHSNVIDQLETTKRTAIDHIIDVRSQGCKSMLSKPRQAL